MAPRRGSGGSSSSYYSSNNPWSQETSFSLDYVHSKTLFITGFAFDVLTILALVSFLIWACLIHNGRGQLKGVIPALSLYLTSMITGLVYNIFFLADATVTMYYVIDLMLNEFFYLAAGCAIILVFYHLIHSILDRLTDAGKPYAAVSIIHWVVLGLVSVVSLATFGLYVAVQVQYVQSSYNTKMLDSYNKLESARSIIWWILSLEIVAWFIFIVVKAGSHRFTSRLPIFSLLGGSIAWMALNLTWAVVYIVYALGTATAPNYLNCVQSVLQFIFLVATFVGILLACSNWRSVDDREDKNGAQYPYGGTQYQPYPTYQQQHPAQYQQQYYQQPYPQPTQQGYQQPVAHHTPQPEEARQD